jgi:hypothetical protein
LTVSWAIAASVADTPNAATTAARKKLRTIGFLHGIDLG